MRFTGAALTEGSEEHHIDGTTVRVTNPGRTVPERFKFRNKIGLDVDLEALQRAQQDKQVSPNKLWRYAEVCRVSNVVRPYLESLS